MTVADRLPGGCTMSTDWFPATEPTPYTVPPGATLTLVTVSDWRGQGDGCPHRARPLLQGAVVCPPPAAMSVPSAVTASAL